MLEGARELESKGLQDQEDQAELDSWAARFWKGAAFMSVGTAVLAVAGLPEDNRFKTLLLIAGMIAGIAGFTTLAGWG